MFTVGIITGNKRGLLVKTVHDFFCTVDRINLLLFYTTSTRAKAHPGFFLLKGMKLRDVEFCFIVDNCVAEKTL